MESSQKKKEYCKNQTYCGERVLAGRVKRRHFQAQHAPAVGRTRPGGEFRVHFWRLFGTLWAHFGALLARIGPLLVPCRARFWLFCTLGVSFWLVLGEIHFLRQYFAKKYTCIDLASNFLQIFRMQIIFPRPGGGTIAAGNRDRPFWHQVTPKTQKNDPRMRRQKMYENLINI